MAEDIIIRYRAETDELIKEINTLIDKQDQLADEAERTSKSFDKAATNEVQAAKRRQQIIQSELQNIEKLKASRARAFDPVLIDRFNRAIQQSEGRIKSLGAATDKESKKMTDSFKNAGNQIKNIGLGIAAGFGAAFSVDAIVNFTKQSVQAFLEAESVANRLKFTITQVNGETEATFDRLIKQSERLQQISVFADDDIQKAQTALATFGLTADQIEELIPKVLDLASANKIDLASATDTVIRGIEGQQKGLKLLGVQLETVGTEAENYAQIIGKLDKFYGAAIDATETLNGQLEQSRNRFGDLQEYIGSVLSGTFTTLKKELFEVIGTLLRFDSTLDQVRKRSNANATSGVDALVSQLEKEGKTINQIEAALKAGAKEAQKRVDGYVDAIQSAELQLALINLDRLDISSAEYEVLVKSLNTNRELLINAEQIAGAYRDRLGFIKDAAETEKRTLDADDLRGKSIQELNKLLEENRKINDSIARSNIQLIQAQIAELEKLSAKEKADAEKRKAEAEAFAEKRKAEAEALRLKRVAEFEKEFQDKEKAQQEFIKNLEAKQKEIDALLEFQVKITLNNKGAEDALNQLRDTLRQRYEEEAAYIDKNAQIEGESAEVTQAKKLKAYEDFAAEYKRIAESLGLFQEQKNEEEVTNWLDRNAEILQSSLEIFQALSSVYSSFSEKRIQDLQKSSESFNETLNAEDEALQESKDKRLISEAEYRKQSDAIEAKRVENEKRVRDAINKERKKQAILNKANALFEIALNTAMAIAKVSAQLGVAAAPFIALVAALGAAQAAAVVAQPIPAFAKGTKGKKGSGMALVGEQGPEITYVPDGAKILPAKQTKTYGEVFDAMYDNKFEKYVYNKFVAPALEEQKRRFADNKSANFADNIVTSMQYNGITTNDLLYANRKGTNIKNADEIAQAIAKALKTSSPDLWRM